MAACRRQYTVTAKARGFADFTQLGFVVTAGQVQQFDIPLDIQVEQEKVEVQDDNTQVQVSPSNNASANCSQKAPISTRP